MTSGKGTLGKSVPWPTVPIWWAAGGSLHRIHVVTILLKLEWRRYNSAVLQWHLCDSESQDKWSCMFFTWFEFASPNRRPPFSGVTTTQNVHSVVTKIPSIADNMGWKSHAAQVCVTFSQNGKSLVRVLIWNTEPTTAASLGGLRPMPHQWCASLHHTIS